MNSNEGGAQVTLCADLGHLLHSGPQQQHHGGRNGPARMRRRERRVEARKNAEAVETSNEKVEAATETTEKVEEHEVQAVEEDIPEETTKVTEEVSDKFCSKQAEQAGINFQCLICDFASNWENGLLVHMTRKHGNIEQFDGNGTFDDLKDDKYSETRHYWETGRLGSAYQSFIDANHIIEKSNLQEDVKESEKAKILDSRKSAFGPNFSYVPPWNR